MEYISDEILIQAIEQQSEIFDSHDVIFTIMRGWAREYTQDLCAALDSSQDPFVKLHTDIGKRLASKDFGDIVEKHDGKRKSLNCRGQEDECQVWRRLNSDDKTTVSGYINRNGQKNLGKREPPLAGTDRGQYVYVINCTECGFVYGANGSDIHLHKCPNCQGGNKGLDLF